MVVIDGVRYRPDDAPKQQEAERAEKPVEHKMRQPKAKKQAPKA